MTGFVDDKWAETTDVDPVNLNAASVPVGGIIMFSGTVAGLPSQWKLCDGTDGTPDLRGRFIVGAGGSYAQGATGGVEQAALSASDIPSHTHGSGSLSSGSAGNHRHEVPARERNASSDHTHGVSSRLSSATGTASFTDYDFQTSLDGSHSHSVSGETGTGFGLGGASPTHENRPPFYALAFIQRVA